MEGLCGDQRLDYEASVERDRIGQEKLRLLNGEDAARGGIRTVRPDWLVFCEVQQTRAKTPENTKTRGIGVGHFACA